MDTHLSEHEILQNAVNACARGAGIKVEIKHEVKPDKPNDTLLKYRLRKDPLGEVTLLYRFWDPDVIPADQDMVHPLLVYADLMATGEQRNLETARIIYEKYILRLVGED